MGAQGLGVWRGQGVMHIAEAVEIGDEVFKFADSAEIPDRREHLL